MLWLESRENRKPLFSTETANLIDFGVVCWLFLFGVQFAGFFV